MYCLLKRWIDAGGFRLHCKQDPIFVFPEMKLFGLVPAISTFTHPSQIHKWRNWERRPRSLIFGNICYEILVQCLCIVGPNLLCWSSVASTVSFLLFIPLSGIFYYSALSRSGVSLIPSADSKRNI
jgi:hypothetical protein